MFENSQKTLAILLIVGGALLIVNGLYVITTTVDMGGIVAFPMLLLGALAIVCGFGVRSGRVWARILLWILGVLMILLGVLLISSEYDELLPLLVGTFFAALGIWSLFVAYKFTNPDM